MKIHHIGYTVCDIVKSMEAFRDMGYSVGEVTVDDGRHVKIAFARMDGTLVELVSPIEGVDVRSPVDSILQKSGPTPYHICYEVDDLASAVQDMKRKGWTLLIKPSRAPALENRDVVFLYSPIVGLIELVARDLCSDPVNQRDNTR
jgi:methylmalonyl-CoA/ethylmalonyl-CoA epimerase